MSITQSNHNADPNFPNFLPFPISKLYDMKTCSKAKGGIFVKASCTAVPWTELDERAFAISFQNSIFCYLRTFMVCSRGSSL